MADVYFAVCLKTVIEKGITNIEQEKLPERTG